MNKEFKKSTSLTFTDNDCPGNNNVNTTFQDDETVLLTINMSFHQKASIKELRKKILHSVKEDSLFDEMLKEEDYKINKNTLFFLMFQNFIEYMLEDKDENFVKSVKDAMLFTEQSDILSNLSERKFDMAEDSTISLVEVERVPSNYSMSLCSCCKSPEETNNRDDYSRDIFVNKKKDE